MSDDVAQPRGETPASFVDLVTGRECRLVVNLGYPPVVEHPDCDQPADVAVEVDAFFCTACRWSGRISGAWVVDMVEEVHRARR